MDDTQERDGLGWRAKIGILVPDANSTVQPECEALRPDGVTNHTARIPNIKPATGDMMRFDTAKPETLADACVAIDRVVPVSPDIIVLAHSVDAFCGGVKGSEIYEAALTDHAGGIRVEAPAFALDRALKAMGEVRKLGILTPFKPVGDEVTAHFFRDAGYDVAAVIGLKRPNGPAIATTPQAMIREALRTLLSQEIDAVIQVGTNLPMARLGAEAEGWFGKPVLQVNVASYWSALRRLGIDDRIQGHGRLLAEH